MPIRNTVERWGSVAKSLHWLVAALVATQFVLANIAEDLPLSVEKIATLARHKSIGITILGLALLRLLWRLYDRRPAAAAPAGSWTLRLAQLTHGAMYVLLFAVPLAGWIMSSARNFPVSWFGLWQLPDLVSANDATYRAAHETHEALATALGLLALLHIAAALKHHFIDRDNVLRRMLPFGMLAGVALLSPANNQAATPVAYVQALPKSQLEFRFMQAGAETSGRFEKFTVRLLLDPKGQPASLQVAIDVSSLNTKDAERDTLLRGAELFDVAKHPQARFAATRLVSKGGDRYEAAGELTIRDIRKSLNLPLRLMRNKDGKPLNLSGEIGLSRLAFGVGQGDWRSTEWVGDTVKVSFLVALTAQTGP